MDEVIKKMNTEEQTPIEIALDIDADGWTTAKKLYDWLELDPTHFSRWCEQRILNNPYVDEMEFSPLRAKTSDKGGRPSDDYAISGDLAKMLAISSKSEKGNAVRSYYSKIENAFKITVKQYKELENKMVELQNNFAVLEDRITKRNQMSPWEEDCHKKIQAWREGLNPNGPTLRNNPTDDDMLLLLAEVALNYADDTRKELKRIISTYSEHTGDYKPSFIKVVDSDSNLRKLFDNELYKRVRSTHNGYVYREKRTLDNWFDFDE